MDYSHRPDVLGMRIEGDALVRLLVRGNTNVTYCFHGHMLVNGRSEFKAIVGCVCGLSIRDSGQIGRSTAFGRCRENGHPSC